MLNANFSETPGEERWILHGRLTNPWVQELRAYWKVNHRPDVGRASIVDLDEVTFVDAFMNYQPTHDQIKDRAYQIYLERGARPGNELDDWLRAERELERIALYTRSWNRLSVLDGRQVLKFEDYHDGRLEL